jgi:chemotaxis protein CheC
MTADQEDALLELFNVGVGLAAASLSVIVKEEIWMSVPRIEILNAGAEGDRGAVFGQNRICAVSQHFSGPFDADAMLIFPEDKTMLIVQKMLGDQVAAEDLSEMERDALSEIGNIILNTCVGSIGDTFQQKFRSTAPVYSVGSTNEVVFHSASDENVVLVLHIEFILKKNQIPGYLVLLLNVHSYSQLLASIDGLLARYST